MTSSDIQEITQKLKRKEAELLRSICQRDGVQIQQSADAVEMVLSAQARQMAADNLSRSSELLLQVRTALRQLEAGEFGICVRCDDDIHVARLKAVPWASLCIRCQEKQDRQNRARAAA